MSLFTVMVALAIFALFTAAIGELAIERIRGTKRNLLQERANYACEAGFILATEWLEQQIKYTDASNSMTSTAVNPTQFNNNHTNITLAVDKETLLTVRITSNLLPPPAASGAAITGPDGVTIEPGQIYVQCLATVGGDLAPASSRHLGGFGSLGTQDFPYAIQCEGPVNLTNSVVTTYTSYDLGNPGQALSPFWEYHKINILGPNPFKYPPPFFTKAVLANVGNPPPAMPGVFVNGARVLSNARVKAITLSNSKVDGQLFCGAGVLPSTAISANPVQSWVAAAPTASAAPLFITKYKPPVEPSTVSQNHNGGSLVVNNGTWYKDCIMNGGKLTLQCNSPGTNEFYFANSLNLTGVQVEVGNANVDTRAKVYVGKELVINGCQVNAQLSKDGSQPGAGPGSFPSPLIGPVYRWPFNLEFLGVGSGGQPNNPTGQTQATISNNSHVFALFAGAAMNLSMSGGIYGGSIKCNSASLNGVTMYYDVGVNAVAVANTLWGRVSWTMQGVTDYGDALYAAALGGFGAAGGLAPQGPGAVAAGQLEGGVSANLGANAGNGIIGPNTGNVGTGPNAAGASFGVVSTTPSFWAALFLGQ